MSEWQIVVNDGEETLDDSDGLYDVRTVDTFNPFGDYATAWFDDIEGELFEIFNRGTKVSFQYNDDTTTGFVQDFVGFVVNDFENEADGAEQLEVEAYTFDQFLRGDEVSNSQEGKLISEALEDVIKTDVPPIDWDASLVDVEDDIELTRSYQGENVEEFLLDLRQKSGGEFPSVTEDLKFEWKLPEIERTERDIDNTQWITHDISEQGGDTKNQITVVFDDGDRAVTVDKSGDQLRTQENLGASGPAQQAADPLVIDDITTIDDAIDAGERFLQRRESTITGPVTTFGLNSAEPGNVIGVTIEPRGIDSDFRIAENRTRWRGETNELVVVQKKGTDDDILLEQTDRVRRVEGRSRDLDVTPDRVTDTDPVIQLSVLDSTFGIEWEEYKFTTNWLSAIRDALINEGEAVAEELRIGDGDRRPSRSDDGLDNQLQSTTNGGISTPTTNGVDYTTGDFSAETNVREFGLFANGECYFRAVTTEPIDLASDDQIGVQIRINTTSGKSIWTNSGETLTRDIISLETPDYPASYAYGSGDSEPDPTQISLDTEVVAIDLDSILIQSASTNADFEQLVETANDEPVRVANDQLELTQIAFTKDSNDFDVSGAFLQEDPAYSGGQAEGINGADVSISITFDVNHTIPGEEFALWVRFESLGGDSPGLDVEFNGESWNPVADGANFDFLDWRDLTTTFGSGTSAYSGADISPGTYDLTITGVSEDSGTQAIDVIAPADDRYNITLDNDNGGDGGFLDGPELYPDSLTKSFDTASTRRTITEASFTSTWNDTSNSQYVELANDGSNFTRFDNSSSGSATFSSSDRGVDTNIALSRYGTQNATPATGNNGQAISSWSLTANPESITNEDIGVANVRAIVEDSEAVDDTFAEAGLKATSGDMLTRSLIPQFVKSDDQLVVSSERLRWEND